MAMFVPNWFDLVAAGVLIYGLVSGRKKGMSEELLDMLQWITIAFLTPRIYEPPGRMLAAWIKFNPGPVLVASYVFFAILIVAGFGYVRKATGQKLLGKDTFGHWEHWLGMAGGVVRAACMIIVALALINAKYISPEALAENDQMQQESFGSIRLPTAGSIQQDVFKNSRVGLWTQYHFKSEMIAPAAPVQYEVKKIEGLGKKMERAAEEALEKK